ncbi:hypothetical protein [Deinococcus aluminii]|uniref:Urease accessory protein UreD n=1 Tax=Deinococcus aluminii TaxID=1656885 RepID=A0ABP9XH67_9DEIO
MKENSIEHLRLQGGELRLLATLLVQGDTPRHAMDRAALRLNVGPGLAPDLLVLHAVPGPPDRILPGDILVGGGVTTRVLPTSDIRPTDFTGHVLALR